MLIKLLGAIDVVAGLVLMFGFAVSLSPIILLIFGIILLAKSFLGFLKSFASWIDFISGIAFLVASFLGIPGFILFILGILLLQKGIFSFL